MCHLSVQRQSPTSSAEKKIAFWSFSNCFHLFPVFHNFSLLFLRFSSFSHCLHFFPIFYHFSLFFCLFFIIFSLFSFVFSIFYNFSLFLIVFIFSFFFHFSSSSHCFYSLFLCASFFLLWKGKEIERKTIDKGNPVIFIVLRGHVPS